jgi:hypothetical protein
MPASPQASSLRDVGNHVRDPGSAGSRHSRNDTEGENQQKLRHNNNFNYYIVNFNYMNNNRKSYYNHNSHNRVIRVIRVIRIVRFTSVFTFTVARVIRVITLGLLRLIGLRHFHSSRLQLKLEHQKIHINSRDH